MTDQEHPTNSIDALANLPDDPNRIIAGERIISPHQVQQPDGSLKHDWESAFASALTGTAHEMRTAAAAEQRDAALLAKAKDNFRAVYEEALIRGIPEDVLIRRLGEGGTNLVKKSESDLRAEYTQRISEALARLKAGDNSVAADIQRLVKLATIRGVDKGYLEQLLTSHGIAVKRSEKQIPASIDAPTYNALGLRYVQLREKVNKSGRQDLKLRFVGSPYGKIQEGAFPGGDTPERRKAYVEITELLDSIDQELNSP